MQNTLKNLLDKIEPVSRELETQIQAHLDDLTHPPGSLGRLEETAMHYCLIRQTLEPKLEKKRIYTFAADHGVAEENLSIAPKEVTQQMVLNMLGGGAGVNVLSRHAGVENKVVDIGVDHDFGNPPGLINCKVRYGTANIRKGPAMSFKEAEQAILAGAELAREAAEEGTDILGTGEMGIANTTPASALFAAWLPTDAETVTGRGTGINDEQLARKVEVIREALETNRAALGDPLSTLAALGGLEIAGICGLCLGAAAARIPVMVDGFISSAGAFAAIQLKPEVKDYLFFSHRSAEAGHKIFLGCIDSEPLLDLGMRLGEGTGAALAINLIDASIKIYNEMATFSGAGIKL
ncbi:MAG: nicotinate-nucleotide--dimethylbenzimidazole phosphoribosyltransferase [Verrucomicrobiota bacterium]